MTFIYQANSGLSQNQSKLSIPFGYVLEVDHLKGLI